MKRGGTLAAAMVLLITNGVVLMEAARNRRGEALQTIRLTERELPLSARTSEDTGVELQLNWNRLDYVENVSSWLNEPKLFELGFDKAPSMPDTLHPPLPRPVFIALEYNGPAWEKWVTSASQTNASGQIGITSRLIPVDAAKTPQSLLQRYKGRGEYLIVRGVIQLTTVNVQGRPQLRPFVSRIIPDTIHVTPQSSNQLRHFLGSFILNTPAIV